jgi:hypothetical protein
MNLKMKITTLLWTAGLAAGSLAAQQAPPAKENSTPAHRESNDAGSQRAYRFLYTLTELNGKQKINSRSFEILTRDRGEVHSSSKINVPTHPNGDQFQPVTVGLNAEMHFMPANEGDIYQSAEVGLFFLVAQEGASSGTPPTIRTISTRADTRVKVGVPTVISVIEDVASTHSYELSVTVNPK